MSAYSHPTCRICCRSGFPRWQLLTRIVLPVPTAPRMSGRGRGCATAPVRGALLEEEELEAVEVALFMSLGKEEAGWNDDIGRRGLLPLGPSDRWRRRFRSAPRVEMAFARELSRVRRVVTFARFRDRDRCAGPARCWMEVEEKDSGRRDNSRQVGNWGGPCGVQSSVLRTPRTEAGDDDTKNDAGDP